MQQPTGSISDRHGWEWNRLQVSQGGTQRPAAPDQPTGRQNPQQRIEQLEREVARLRTELKRREQQRAEIVRQYERCLAEKNREIDEKSESDTVVETILDPIR